MSKHKIDPSLPYEEFTAPDGRVLKCCLDFRSLAAAEDELARRGHDVNLNLSLLRGGLSSTMVLFAASLMAYHRDKDDNPEFSFEEAQAFVTPATLVDVITTLNAAREKAYPPPVKKANPPKPAGQSGD